MSCATLETLERFAKPRGKLLRGTKANLLISEQHIKFYRSLRSKMG